MWRQNTDTRHHQQRRKDKKETGTQKYLLFSSLCVQCTLHSRRWLSEWCVCVCFSLFLSISLSLYVCFMFFFRCLFAFFFCSIRICYRMPLCIVRPRSLLLFYSSVVFICISVCFISFRDSVRFARSPVSMRQWHAMHDGHTESLQ